jgi:FtsP/CotA-like multicopper oxidase with cupredoxin domain
MRPISRRRALQLGGLGLASTLVGGVGFAYQLNSGRQVDPATEAELVEPAVLTSSGGVLDLRLEAAQRRVRLAGREANVFSFNGAVPGPTLYLRPGDRLRIELVNGLDDPTNLHTHGLHVSPRDSGDNPFVTIEPGGLHRYDIHLPDDHPQGVYWYHPHHHGLVADQIFGGLYGAIIVADPAPLPVSRERVLIIADTSLDAAGNLRPVSTMQRMMGREGDLVLVNGQVQPRLTARPGERQRWRVINACTARYLRLRLDGQQLHLLGTDSGRYAQPRELSELLLTTGNRADLLVTTRAGISQLRALPYDRGNLMGMGMGNDSPLTDRRERLLATLDVSGPSTTLPAELPIRLAPRDLRTTQVAARRELTFAVGMGMGAGGMMRFSIDGKEFNPDRVDQQVRLGAVEEWVVTNTSPMDHPLHLHVWPMQIIEHRDQPVDPPAWQDVVNLPAQSRTIIRIAFDAFPGRTVYHCHILDHEDNGMMGVIEVR